jgi:hypothetical protein
VSLRDLLIWAGYYAQGGEGFKDLVGEEVIRCKGYGFNAASSRYGTFVKVKTCGSLEPQTGNIRGPLSAEMELEISM